MQKCFWILQVIKTGSVEGLGTRLATLGLCTIYVLSSVVLVMDYMLLVSYS